MYSLPEGSRVVDAIRAAGGLTQDASERDVNQASVVADGMQIVVPTLEELSLIHIFTPPAPPFPFIRC